ncbi:KlcB family protein [Pseudomonas sp. NPDC098740]|uniref:KlcB family protein n=1 Tax=Pseudomonas sp. NPDC098740 TaxID=3364486 RepID=UPI00383A93E9
MARKKPMQYVPREERPEFLALVAELANVQPEQFAGLAMQYAEKYHDAVLAGHVEVLDQMESAYGALVYKLNGETMMGCMADADSAGHVLARAVAARPGQVPRWGQAGEFLLEVEGVRVWVVMTDDMLGNHRACDLHAVDLDKPFISETGYRSAGLTVTSSLGDTVDQSARRMVLDVMKSEGRLKAIKADAWARSSPKKRPGWLADALAGVRPDGQLAMFGDAPKDPSAKVALSNAERQRRHRQRLKELADTEGLKAIALTQTDRMVLSLGLLAHEDLFHRPKDWETSNKPGFDSLLVKLWPEGDNGRYLAEPKRSSYRPAAFLRDELERQRGMVQRLEAIQRQGGELAARELTDARRVPAWEALPSDFARAALAMGLLRLRNNQHAELVRAVELLQARLRDAGLSDRVSTDKKQWYWNEATPADYRATGAPEYMERIPAAAKVDEAAELRRQVTDLQRENALLESERNKAHKAIKTWEGRLKAAGLPTDYRKQSGE